MYDQQTGSQRQNIGAHIGDSRDSYYAGTGFNNSWGFEVRCGASCTMV